MQLVRSCSSALLETALIVTTFRSVSMGLPYGFSVGDFVTVGTLAWNVYKSCKAAPGSFSNISNEVLSLHAVLKEADETISKSPLLPKSQARLKTIGDGCQCVLSDLQALLDRYEKLGTHSKRTWDRMKWGAEDIVEIRSRLISNATMLTAFIRWAPFSIQVPNFHADVNTIQYLPNKR